jgi:superfamily I DNA/RNA helicase
MSWLIPRNELTPDQTRAIELSPSEHRAITGGPGSGKTQVLLHRARHLCDTWGVPPDRFLIIVFTNVLKEYIKSALTDLRLPEDSVVGFDKWCMDFYKAHVKPKLPWDAANKKPDFEEIRRATFERTEWPSETLKLPLYDFILVDEGQDLDEDAFTLFTRIARHVTVAIDNKQQIYDNGSTEAGIVFKLGLRQRNINFIDAFRVCPYLVEVAACLIPSAAEREAFRQQKRTVQTERQTPLLYFARDFEDEKRMLYQMVRERQLMNERIAILFPQNRQVFGFAQGLKEVGIEVEVPKQGFGQSTMPTHDFSSSRPKLMAYHSAKGLTFDSVFMPRLVPASFKSVRAERVERLVFVALTRASKWAYFSTGFGETLPLIEKLLPLEQTRQLTVRRGDQPRATTLPPKNTPPPGRLDFL